MYRNNYSRSPTLEEVEWEDESKKGKHSQKCNIYFKLCLPKMLGRGGGVYAGILARGLIPLCILVQASDGGSYGGVVLGVISMFLGGDPGGPPIPHHLQCGGRISVESLDIVGGRRRRREGRVGNGGDTPRRHFYADYGHVKHR